MLATSNAATTNLLLIVVAFPSAMVAVFTIADRIDRRRERAKREEDQRITDMVARALFGEDRTKWPTGRINTPPMAQTLQAVAEQVKPSNGKTVAMTAEETRQILEQHRTDVMAKLEEQNSVVSDLNQGMAKVTVLVAEHVSDGHGGRTSW